MKMPSLADGVFIWLSLAAGFFILRLEVEAPAVKEKKETKNEKKMLRQAPNSQFYLIPEEQWVNGKKAKLVGY